MQVTAVEIKDYLEHISYLGASISEEREKLQMIFCQVTKTTPQLSGMPGGGGSDRDALLTSYLNAKDQLSYDAKIANDQVEKAIVLISDSDLEVKQKRILKYRYITGVTWKVIAINLQLSERQIYRLHEKALDNLADYVNKNKIKL